MSKDRYSPALRLKAATATDHQATENLLGLGRVGQKQFLPPAYRQLVGTNYFVWSSFSAEMRGLGPGWWLEYLPLVETMAGAATTDFSHHSAVGESFRALPYPAIADQYALAGSIYVHLGSLLGSRFIHGALLGNESLQDYRPFRFYAASLDFTGVAWRRVVENIDDTLRDEGHLQTAIGQARRVFAYYQDIYGTLGKVE